MIRGERFEEVRACFKDLKPIEVRNTGYIFSSALQLPNSCSCCAAISLTHHVVCTKCYQANS